GRAKPAAKLRLSVRGADASSGAGTTSITGSPRPRALLERLLERLLEHGGEGTRGRGPTRRAAGRSRRPGPPPAGSARPGWRTTGRPAPGPVRAAGRRRVDHGRSAGRWRR